MLVRLTSKLIAQYWDVFKDCIRASVENTHDCAPDRLQRIFEACMLGKMQCWLLAEGDDLVGACITRVEFDDITEQNRLLIYAHHVWTPVPLPQQVNWFYPIVDFAKNLGCARICAAFSNHTLATAYAELTGSTLQFWASKEL